MAKWANYFGYGKFVNLREMIKRNGGIGASIGKLARMDDMRFGCYVGEDKYGNKYYEDKTFFVGRSRWVEYAKYLNLEYNASQIPPEWFGWIHYRTDIPPTEDNMKMYKWKWMLDHSENATGTTDSYMPYDTTRPKIKAWKQNSKEVQQKKSSISLCQNNKTTD